MTKGKENLKLFEAIELRNEYDKHIKLLDELIGGTKEKHERFYLNRNEDEDKSPVPGFSLKETEERLKKYQTKKVKLNQAIQAANFTNKIDFDNDKISLAEALEIRKNLQTESEGSHKRVVDAAYNRVLHKEERDIVLKPARSFNESCEDFNMNTLKLRRLISRIHVANHNTEVEFKDE